MRTTRGFWAVLVLMLAMSAAIFADTEIHFPKGANGTTIKGAIARGETGRYTLDASKGQLMKVSITSAEGNAVFSVFSDGGQISKDELTSWQGRLPLTGTYAIEVGSERGGADFQLHVEIH